MVDNLKPAHVSSGPEAEDAVDLDPAAEPLAEEDENDTVSLGFEPLEIEENEQG